ncbi:molecular chaperone [Acinetobacter bereziniae]|uniref:Molecular chaperone n=1 Tax=Acinetobacter bereziniae TaxID=106648 RepID=A0A8I1DJI5_ACIBZ|nr:molecular chaperone [Acinetobacter bereziniae]QQC83542.1 molecular chaperone [Acinetobacter bereziniae]UUN96710.1 molecular chaperone [Acinetobacter bereziniae]
MRYLQAAICVFLTMPLAYAGVSIDGTRIIFPAQSKSVNVQLRNIYDTPALVQAWIDNGDPKKTPQAEEVPFVLNPPLVRIEPNKGQIIRIIPLDTSKLAKDRESIYWFNILDIPPSDPNLADKNHLSFTVRTRVKLFYRPTQLAMKADHAQKSLQFKLDRSINSLTISNPTPYYITVLQVESGKNHAFNSGEDAIMLEPFSSRSLKNFILDLTTKKISYEIVNDLGAVQTFEAVMQ